MAHSSYHQDTMAIDRPERLCLPAPGNSFIASDAAGLSAKTEHEGGIIEMGVSKISGVRSGESSDDAT